MSEVSPKLCSEISCDATYIRITELTGANSSGNDTGWGAPNTEIADILTATFDIYPPDSTTLQPSATKVAINVIGLFPRSNPSAYYDVQNLTLGYTSGRLPDGAWRINPVYSDGVNIFQEDITGDSWQLFDTNIVCGIQTLNSRIKWQNGSCCDTTMLDAFLDLNAKYLSMWASWDCGNVLEALERMKEIKRKLNKFLNC